MDNLLYYVMNYFPIILGIIFITFLIINSNSIVFIPNNKFGIVEKKWSFNDKKSESFMSENGSPGFLYELLVGGWHFFFPFQYKVHKQNFITVGEIGYIFARTGANIPSGQALASWPENVNIEDAQSFIQKGGQRGPQRKILRGGSYAINTALFAIITDSGIFSLDNGDDKDEIKHLSEKIERVDGFNPIIVGEDNIAIVTVQDGPSLEHGDVIAPTVGGNCDPNSGYFHNGFQDIEAFLNAGGRRGNQEQVLTEGTYYINRLFATIQISKKTVIDIGYVGVVNSITGKIMEKVDGKDIASVVPVGYRGIWDTPLRPGKYAYNPSAYNIKPIPTTNFQLRWLKIDNNSKDYDANLSEIKLITKDAFEPILPLTIVVSILPADAPKVIQQFSDVVTLVNETLDPMVSAWFKDSAQAKTLLELVLDRADLQKNALDEMSKRFQNYHLNVREVMIGTPRADIGDNKITMVFDQLRQRQIAIESATTYAQEKKAADVLKSLNESKAIAEQQTDLTASQIAIDIAKNQAEGNLETKRREAEATILTANADASRIKSIGEAEAQSLEAQAKAVGGQEAVLRKSLFEIFMNGLSKAQQPLVPGIMMGKDGGENNIASILFSLMLEDGKLDNLVKSSELKNKLDVDKT